MRLVFCLALLVCAAACKSTPTLDGPCDSKQMAQLRKAVAGANPADRALIALTGLSEACEAKLPSGIVETIKALGDMSPADRATVIAAGLADNTRFADRACPDWEKTSSAALQLGRSKRSAALYAACHYERFDLLTPAELETSWKGGAFALLAVPLYAWLIENGMQIAEAKQLARDAFLGQELSPD